MTPEELAAIHSRLVHIIEPGAWDGILRHGLLSADALTALFELKDPAREILLASRRPGLVALTHATHATAVLNDNLPLSERALASCLDDGLTPQDWLRMLNARVFFWPDEASAATLLGARFNRGRTKEILVFDTLGLISAHADRVELCPINSGATIRKPARRGLAKFTPLAEMTYRDWQRRRGGRDVIREIVVRDGVRDIERFLLDRRTVVCNGLS